MAGPRPWLIATLLGLVVCSAVVAGLWYGSSALHTAPTLRPPDAAGCAPADPGPTPDARPASPDRGRAAADGAGAAGFETEQRLMARLRQAVEPRPLLALRLLREAAARFPGSQLADERALLKMRALVHLGRIAAARDEAVRFFKRHPHSPLGARVHRLTGVHPRPRPGP